MKKPTKEAVLEAMRPEVRYNAGASRLVEAVELDSGILVVEYQYTMKFVTDRGYRFQRKICIKSQWDRPPYSVVVDSGYVSEFPTRGKASEQK